MISQRTAAVKVKLDNRVVCSPAICVKSVDTNSSFPSTKTAKEGVCNNDGPALV